jgi:hypothetical protein
MCTSFGISPPLYRRPADAQTSLCPLYSWVSSRCLRSWTTGDATCFGATWRERPSCRSTRARVSCGSCSLDPGRDRSSSGAPTARGRQSSRCVKAGGCTQTYTAGCTPSVLCAPNQSLGTHGLSPSPCRSALSASLASTRNRGAAGFARITGACRRAQPRDDDVARRGSPRSAGVPGETHRGSSAAVSSHPRLTRGYVLGGRTVSLLAAWINS